MIKDIMTSEEARAVLRKHTAPPQDDGGQPGFLAALRPYRGLDERHFAEIMSAIETLGPELRRSAVDRELMADLWELMFLPWLWALAPDGMLQRGHKVSSEDQVTLAKWLEEIGLRVSLMLGSADGDSVTDDDP
jgi:hypothetical protein